MNPLFVQGLEAGGNLIMVLAPRRAKVIAAWLEDQSDPSYRAAAFLMGALALFVGFIFLCVDWYTSIQGIRIPLAQVGLISGDLWRFPAWYWWLYPVVLTLLQMLPKAFPLLQFIWVPATAINGATTAAFLGVFFDMLFRANGVEMPIIITVIVVTFLGALITIGSEMLLLLAAVLIRSAIVWN